MTALLSVLASAPFLWAALSPLDFAQTRDSGRILQLAQTAVLVLLIFFSKREAKPADGRMARLWILLPAAAASFHLLAFTMSARTALFFQDQDITNISSAIANTAMGRGILPTAYVDTGLHGSYLGHHFAPALLLFTPVYAAFPAADQSLYPFLLWVVFTAGCFTWTRLVRIILDSRTAGLIVLLVLSMFPLLRVTQSFHNEIFVFLFSGLAFLGLRTQRMPLFWTGLILWMMVKEDTAVYTALFGLVHFAWPTDELNRRRSLQVLIVSCSWIVFSRAGQYWAAGGQGPDWSSFFRPDWPALQADPEAARWKSAVIVLASTGFLACLRIRYAAFLLPVMSIHLLSRHPWHSTYYGHYAYAVLPVLLFCSLAEAQRRSFRFLLAACAVAMFVNAGDRETPSPLFASDPRYEALQNAGTRIPPGACVRAEKRAGVFVPISAIAFPAVPFPGNPHNNKQGLDGLCESRYHLTDSGELEIIKE